MAAGAVTITIKDGAGTSRTVNMWSSDGTATGTLTPLQTLVGVDGVSIASAANGAPVTFATGATAQITGPTPATTEATLATGQAVIATTGTAVQLGSNALTRGVTVKSSPNNNAAGMTLGGSGVTNAVDGTGNGYILYPGDSVFLQVANSNQVYINGTIGDIATIGGN